MVYSNSYMFLSLGVFVLLSSHVLAYNMRADPSIHGESYSNPLDFFKSYKNQFIFILFAIFIESAMYMVLLRRKQM